jgi:hypothetical protein
LRVDWAPNSVDPNEPCTLQKDEDDLCIEARKVKGVLASSRDETSCPECGYRMEIICKEKRFRRSAGSDGSL